MLIYVMSTSRDLRARETIILYPTKFPITAQTVYRCLCLRILHTRSAEYVWIYFCVARQTCVCVCVCVCVRVYGVMTIIGRELVSSHKLKISLTRFELKAKH